MGIPRRIRRVASPVSAVVNTKLETLFRHVSNEARDTRELVWREMEDLRRETREIEHRTHEVVDPAMTTVAEASTLLQHAALRVERRLVDLSLAIGAEQGLSGLATTRAAVEVPFALAALGRAATDGEVVVVGPLPLLALLAASAGRPTTLVAAGPSPHRSVRSAEGEGWSGPSTPAALVAHSLARAPVAADAEAVEASARWISPQGRLVLMAPVGSAGPGAGLEAALVLLGRAGWLVTHRAEASLDAGGWSRPDTPGPGDLSLVELARAANGA